MLDDKYKQLAGSLNVLFAMVKAHFTSKYWGWVGRYHNAIINFKKNLNLCLKSGHNLWLLIIIRCFTRRHFIFQNKSDLWIKTKDGVGLFMVAFVWLTIS